MRRVVIVGGSLGGHHAAASLRRLGFDGALVVVGDERHRPYDRFPLSKGFLTEDTSRSELDVTGDVPDVVWRLGARATGLDLAGRTVVVDDRERIEFDGLVVASGARPRDMDSVTGLEERSCFAPSRTRPGCGPRCWDRHAAWSWSAGA